MIDWLVMERSTDKEDKEVWGVVQEDYGFMDLATWIANEGTLKPQQRQSPSPDKRHQSSATSKRRTSPARDKHHPSQSHDKRRRSPSREQSQSPERRPANKSKGGKRR